MLLRCQTFTEISLHVSWGQKGTDAERSCQEALQVSHLNVGDLDMLRLWVLDGKRLKSLNVRDKVADEFLGLGCLAVT